jgi:hypothetical protein
VRPGFTLTPRYGVSDYGGVCEKCRRVPECRYCFCEGLPDNTIVFLTVGPHDRAYTMK